MYKILGLISLFIAFSFCGFYFSGKLCEKVRLLKEIHKEAIHIKNDFEYRAPAIYECFDNRGEFFSKVQEYILNKNMSPFDAIKTACDDFKVLNDNDAEAILSFAKNLSAEETGGQISNISWFIKEMETSIEVAEEEYKTKGRLYKSGGVLMGLGVVILLL